MKYAVTLALLGLFFCPAHLKAQFADTDYYLADSLVLSEVHPVHRELLDTILPQYHRATHDSVRLALLEELIESCADEDFREKYNAVFTHMAKEGLDRKNISEKEKDMYRRCYATGLIYNGLYLDHMGYPDTALQQYLTGLGIFREVGYEEGIAYTLNNIGAYYHEKGDLSQALAYYGESMEINKKIGDERGVGSLLFNMAGIYDSQGAIPQALAHYAQSLFYMQKIGSRRGEAYCLNNMATIYEAQDDHENALANFEKCSTAFAQEDDKRGLAFTLNNIGSVHRQMGHREEALKYLKESLQLGESIGEKDRIANAAINLGTLYEDLGDYKLAIEYLEKSRRVFWEIGQQEGVGKSMVNMANLHLRLGQLEAARAQSEKAMQIARALGMPGLLESSALTMSKVYKRQGKWKEALETYELHVQMRDSVANEKNKVASARSVMQHEYDQKKLADSLEFALAAEIKNLELAATNAQLAKEQSQRYAMYGGFGLVMLVTGVVYKSYRSKTRDNKIIVAQRDLVEKKNRENELLLAEIHHRVKNNLQIISSLLRLQSRKLNNPAAKEALMEGQNRVKAMALIHQKLYQNDRFSGLEAKGYFQSLLENLLESYRFDKSIAQIEVPETSLDVDRAITIGLIVNEVVTNSLKHAFDGSNDPRLWLSFEEVNQRIRLTIRDNGKGFDQESVKENKSFGMQLIQSLSEEMNAEYSFSGAEGTVFTLEA